MNININIQVGDDLKLTRQLYISNYTKDEIERILICPQLNLTSSLNYCKYRIIANYNGNSNNYLFQVTKIIKGYYILKRTSDDLGIFYTIINESDMYNYINDSTFELDIKKRRLKNLKALLKD